MRAQDQCLAPNSVLAVFMIINFQALRVGISPGAWCQNGILLLTLDIIIPL